MPKTFDPNAEARLRESFARQGVMATLGMTLTLVDHGEVEIGFPHSPDLTQQHGYIHAGVLATALDSACGYAAQTMMPEDATVLSIEFKTNLLRPAQGERYVVRAHVLKPGRTITVCEAKAFSISNESETLVASMTGTMMAVYERAEVS